MKESLWIPLCALASALSSAAPAGDFNFPAPAVELSSSGENLWATRYYISTAEVASAGVEMRDRNGKPLGHRVSAERFCFGALQGTVRVISGSASTVLNADGLTVDSGAKCHFKALTPKVNANLSRQAFVEVPAGAPHGLGTRGFRLVPYRTIAVDPAHVGRAYYIPSLRGTEIRTGVESKPDGGSFVHDGYVFGADVGAAIHFPHVDFFTGFSHLPPPAFVTSRPNGLFKAYRVTDPAIVAKLEAMHRVH